MINMIIEFFQNINKIKNLEKLANHLREKLEQQEIEFGESLNNLYNRIHDAEKQAKNLQISRDDNALTKECIERVKNIKDIISIGGSVYQIDADIFSEFYEFALKMTDGQLPWDLEQQMTKLYEQEVEKNGKSI